MRPWEWSEFWDDIGRLAAAAFLGGAIGLERELKGHWAGLRTHMMVAIGCAIFVIGGLNLSGEHSDAVTRVIQGISAGIGFLGAGTILKLDDKQEIKGLTTASSIWLAAAVGTVAGLAEYALALASALTSVFILGVLGPIEKLFSRRQARRHKESEETDRIESTRKQ